MDLILFNLVVSENHMFTSNSIVIMQALANLNRNTVHKLCIKTDNNMEMFKVYERYIDPLRKMYQIINAENGMLDDTFKARLNGIEPEEVVRIGRREKLRYLLEDADFSLYRIKKQTSEGEKDPEHILARKKEYDICA